MYTKFTFDSVFVGVPTQEYYDIGGGPVGAASQNLYVNGAVVAGIWEPGVPISKITTGDKVRISETKLNNLLSDIRSILINPTFSPYAGHTIEVREGSDAGWSNVANKTANTTAALLDAGNGGTTSVGSSCNHFYRPNMNEHWYQIPGSSAITYQSGAVVIKSDWLHNPYTAVGGNNPLPASTASTTLTGIKTYYVRSNTSPYIYLEIKFVYNSSGVHPYSIRLTSYRYVNSSGTTTNATNRITLYQYDINIQGDNELTFPANINDPIDNPGTIHVSSSAYHALIMGRTMINATTYSGYLFCYFNTQNQWLTSFNSSKSDGSTRAPTWVEIPIPTTGVLSGDVYGPAKVSALKDKTTLSSAVTISTGSSAKYQLYTMSGLSKNNEAAVQYGSDGQSVILFDMNVIDYATGMQGNLSSGSNAYMLVGNIPEDETEITVGTDTYVVFKNICVKKG